MKNHGFLKIFSIKVFCFKDDLFWLHEDIFSNSFGSSSDEIFLIYHFFLYIMSY